MLRVPAEQDLGDRQANQLGVGEARWSTRAMTNEGRQEVVDFDVECHDGCRVLSPQTSVRPPRLIGYGLLPFRSQFGINHLVQADSKDPFDEQERCVAGMRCGADAPGELNGGARRSHCVKALQVQIRH